MITELHQQIEAAFDYRGDVTVTFTDGTSVEGFLANREYTNPRVSKDNFIELMCADGTRPRYDLSIVRDVQLTGEDCAAGKSYQEWLAKQ